MQYEVNIRQSNADGQTALHLAAQNGHQDTTELLLERAPDHIVKVLRKLPGMGFFRSASCAYKSRTINR